MPEFVASFTLQVAGWEKVASRRLKVADVGLAAFYTQFDSSQTLSLLVRIAPLSRLKQWE